MENTEESSIGKKIFKFTSMYIFVFILFAINIFAVAVSLQRNAKKSIFFRFASMIFAFCFGFIYLLINMYSYRFSQKNEDPNTWISDGKNVFPFF